MRSLRSRAVFGGAIWAVLSILVGLFGLGSFLDGVTLARFDEILRDRHTQVVITVANTHGNPDLIARSIVDPAYVRPFSGNYFQIENDDIEPIVSQSLVDQLLPPLTETSAQPAFAEFIGPAGGPVRGIHQTVSFDDGSVWHIRVASSLDRLDADRKELRDKILVALVFICVVGVFGAVLQVSAILRPINNLRKDLLSRWDGEKKFEASAYPKEVAPLVNDINELMDRNREIIGRSRRQAADLAHAIKTPAAIVRNELEVLQEQGHDMHNSMDAIDRLDAMLKRSLARMRADGAVANRHMFTDLDVSLARMSKAFSVMAAQQEKALTTDIVPGMRARIDQADFEEIMGNLLDNGLKWSKHKFQLSAGLNGAGEIVVSIEDDGPGIAKADRDLATRSGQRLDTSQPGTGLGLAIADDLAQAYAGQVTLGCSRMLGGLHVRVRLPVVGG
ncbi:Signal transduction histidine kinase [Yoonia tamlensis]|uniref:histidine kinase n=1 Tax=Yoonia tamlensis TaxID=390270 RepID=A0A1I6FYF3_9RHOB|nr:HAMP domain-containing sensor histidine kinase [Yoonia tamlensis]SFR34963.1 Signal transduction histidine kinase [Yoonia tamlensis]